MFSRGGNASLGNIRLAIASSSPRKEIGMNDWRWWIERPPRLLLGLVLILVLLVVVIFVVKYILYPLLAAAVVIIILLAIIRYALTGHAGPRGGGH